MKAKSLILSRTTLFFGGLIAALIACCPLQTRANTIALSFTGGPASPNASDVTLGWAFTLSSPVLLTDLGFGDYTGSGLADSHLVTIWTSTGIQEAQGTVPSGTGATLTNGFRYEPITSVLLVPGSYTIGAFFPSGGRDLATVNAGSIATASVVTYDGSRSEVGNAFPSGNVWGFSNSYFGPNFQFTTSVPDSGSTWALLLLGVTATFGLNLLLHRRSEA